MGKTAGISLITAAIQHHIADSTQCRTRCTYRKGRSKIISVQELGVYLYYQRTTKNAIRTNKVCQSHRIQSQNSNLHLYVYVNSQ